MPTRLVDDSESEWEIPMTEESLAWINSPDFLDTINIIAKNSNKGGWDKKPHVTIQLDLEETTGYTYASSSRDALLLH